MDTEDVRLRSNLTVVFAPGSETRGWSFSNEETGCLPVPPGAPSWVDRELITLTIEVWSPYYGRTLPVEEALEIILNISRAVEGWGWS